LDVLEQLSELDLESNRIGRMEGLTFLSKLKKLNLANNSIKTIENLENLKELKKLVLNKNQIEKVTILHSLKFLQSVDLTDNPIIEAEADSYNLLNENVKLCIELIMQKFDSENLRKTNHHHSVIDKDESNTLEVMEKVKMVRTFAKSFRP
jgi:protein phosphatase 1 regulatory subunit 7